MPKMDLLKSLFLSGILCVLFVSCGGSETADNTLSGNNPSGNNPSGNIPTGNMPALLTWDANQESNLAGYKVYFGTSSKTYGTPIDVGNSTTHTVPNLSQGIQYFFSVTAYDISGNESLFSNEASKIF